LVCPRSPRAMQKETHVTPEPQNTASDPCCCPQIGYVRIRAHLPLINKEKKRHFSEINITRYPSSLQLTPSQYTVGFIEIWRTLLHIQFITKSYHKPNHSLIDATSLSPIVLWGRSQWQSFDLTEICNLLSLLIHFYLPSPSGIPSFLQ
jgi:hypothetical protein